MTEKGEAVDAWKQSRITPFRVEDGLVYVEHFVQLGDGQILDELVDESVEEIFATMFDPLDGASLARPPRSSLQIKNSTLEHKDDVCENSRSPRS